MSLNCWCVHSALSDSVLVTMWVFFLHSPTLRHDLFSLLEDEDKALAAFSSSSRKTHAVFGKKSKLCLTDRLCSAWTPSSSWKDSTNVCFSSWMKASVCAAGFVLFIFKTELIWEVLSIIFGEFEKVYSYKRSCYNRFLISHLFVSVLRRFTRTCGRQWCRATRHSSDRPGGKSSARTSLWSDPSVPNSRAQTLFQRQPRKYDTSAKILDVIFVCAHIYQWYVMITGL